LKRSSGATVLNASASLEEPGVARFDVVQEQADPTRFVLVEVYRDAGGASAHKETKHYQLWRDTVADMMASPRQSRKFHSLFPRRGIGESMNERSFEFATLQRIVFGAGVRARLPEFLNRARRWFWS
jgi:quinol monooxygenase YgiN